MGEHLYRHDGETLSRTGEQTPPPQKHPKKRTRWIAAQSDSASNATLLHRISVAEAGRRDCVSGVTAGLIDRLAAHGDGGASACARDQLTGSGAEANFLPTHSVNTKSEANSPGGK